MSGISLILLGTILYSLSLFGWLFKMFLAKPTIDLILFIRAEWAIWTFGLGLLLILVGFIKGTFYENKLKELKNESKKLENELKELEKLENQLKESENKSKKLENQPK